MFSGRINDWESTMGFGRAVLAIASTLVALVLMVPVLVVGLPFWIVACLVHAIACVLEPKFRPWNELIEFDPALGWKPRAALDTYYSVRGEDIFHIQTDFQGWPGRISVGASQMVVIGDSFAFGFGINIRASFAELDPNLRIKAFGAPGYNMVQALLLMRQLAPQLAGKIVVWFICLDNDLYDNLMPYNFDCYRTPFVRYINDEDKWEIVTSHVSPIKWPYSATSRPYYPMLAKLCSPGPLSQRAFSACRFLINEGHEVCCQAGARLVVMTIPNRSQLSPRGLKFLSSQHIDMEAFDPDFPDKQIGEICRACDVPFVAAKKHLDVHDYRERDTHWNGRGHRKIANLLGRLYQVYSSTNSELPQTSNHLSIAI
jgi:hypothetical protein